MRPSGSRDVAVRRCARRAAGAPGEPKAERFIRLGARFEPERSVVPSGVPVRLTLHREIASPDCETLVFPELGRLVTLPFDTDVSVDFPPLTPGEYPFSCSLGIPRGTLVVTAAPARWPLLRTLVHHLAAALTAPVGQRPAGAVEWRPSSALAWR
jgi:hypothetical protein